MLQLVLMKKILLVLVALLISPSFVSAKKYKKAEPGTLVKVSYTGTLKDGKVFDTSDGKEPLSFVIGAGAMLPKFEEAIKGMKLKETKTFVVPAKDAYGDYDPTKLIKVPTAKLPPESKNGDTLSLRTANGVTYPVKLVSRGPEESDIDANHILAGQDLTFRVQLLEVLEAPKTAN